MKEQCLQEIKEILEKYNAHLEVDFVKDKILGSSVLIYKMVIVENAPNGTGTNQE